MITKIIKLKIILKQKMRVGYDDKLKMIIFALAMPDMARYVRIN